MLYSPDWTHTGVPFILLTVYLFRHSTLIEEGLYLNFSYFTVFLKNRNISSKIKRSKVTDYAALRTK